MGGDAFGGANMIGKASVVRKVIAEVAAWRRQMLKDRNIDTDEYPMFIFGEATFADAESARHELQITDEELDAILDVEFEDEEQDDDA